MKILWNEKGNKINAEDEQVHLMVGNGWSLTEPKKKKKEKPAKNSTTKGKIIKK